MFANSSKRWLILKNNVKGLTLKPLFITCWESRVESVKAIRFQLLEIREALLQVADIDNDSKIKSESKSLATNEVGDFEFLVSTVIWYDILSVINLVSKKLQSDDMLINIAVKEVEKLIAFFEEFRDTGFDKAINVAKEIAIEMDIDPLSGQTPSNPQPSPRPTPIDYHLYSSQLKPPPSPTAIITSLVIPPAAYHHATSLTSSPPRLPPQPYHHLHVTSIYAATHPPHKHHHLHTITATRITTMSQPSPPPCYRHCTTTPKRGVWLGYNNQKIAPKGAFGFGFGFNSSRSVWERTKCAFGCAETPTSVRLV
nr:zinc finger MYM-type protein 1 [Tanacetum cinerariifolium]